MSERRFLPYARQSISLEDAQEVAHALMGDIITRGIKVQEFEQAIADLCGARYAVAFNSGTSALSASYFAAALSPSDRVITTPNTFVGTIAGVIQAGATPVFLDIDRATGNIDLNLIEFNINQEISRGREIIMPVHFAGVPIDMKRLDSLIRDVNTYVIEDASHALGATYPSGEKVGSCVWSQMTIFSFHPNKHITTGEGGMVTTNSEELYERLHLYRNNGIVKKNHPLGYYEVQAVTGNFNFTDFQAALGLSQLKRLEEFKAHRSRLVHHYRKRLEGIEGVVFTDPSFDPYSNYHLFLVQIDFEKHRTNREAVMQSLLEKEIGTQVLYIPLYRHPWFENEMGDLIEYFPQMEQYYAQALALPLHCEMDEKDVDRVCEALQSALKIKK